MERVCLKTVVVGAGAAGKTCMLIRLVHDRFPEVYIPTVFDCESHEGTVGNVPCTMGLFDTGGGEDYHTLRPHSYPGTHVFTLLYSITDNMDEIESLFDYWCPELEHHCPGVPIVLVASKIDLRQDSQNNMETLSKADGERIASRMNAAAFVEISSKTGRVSLNYLINY